MLRMCCAMTSTEDISAIASCTSAAGNSSGVGGGTLFFLWGTAASPRVGQPCCTAGVSLIGPFGVAPFKGCEHKHVGDQALAAKNTHDACWHPHERMWQHVTCTTCNPNGIGSTLVLALTLPHAGFSGVTGLRGCTGFSGSTAADGTSPAAA